LTINASSFCYSPYSLPSHCDNGTYRGLEVNIAKAAVNALGLSLEILPTSDGRWWGWEDPPGSGNFSGILGDLQFGRVEISWGNLYVTEDRMGKLDFTQWYATDTFCALTRRPQPITGLEKLYKNLDWPTWLLGIASLAAMIGFSLLRKKKTFVREVLAILSITLKESDQVTHHFHGHNLRFVLSSSQFK